MPAQHHEGCTTCMTVQPGAHNCVTARTKKACRPHVCDSKQPDNVDVFHTTTKQTTNNNNNEGTKKLNKHKGKCSQGCGQAKTAPAGRDKKQCSFLWAMQLCSLPNDQCTYWFALGQELQGYLC